MENKNKEAVSSKEVIKEGSAPKLDPANEIKSGPQEKLIAVSNKDGIYSGVDADRAGESRINQKNSISKKEDSAKSVAGPIGGPKSEFRESENSYGSFDEKSYANANLKKSQKFPVVLIIGILFLFSAIAAAVYFLNPQNEKAKQESSQDIIKSSIEAMKGLKTYNTNGEVNFKYDLNTDEAGSFRYDLNVDLSGKTDISDIENAKSEMNMGIKLEIKGDGGSDDYSLALQGRSFGTKEAYYKIDEMDLGIMGMILGPQITSLKGKWYLLDVEEMKKMPGYDVEEGLAYENYNVNKLMDIVNKREIFKFKEDMGAANVGGVDTYHYKTSLDGMALMYLYIDMLKEMSSNYKGSDLKEMQSSLEKMKKDIEENYKDLINEGFQNLESEVWIGKDNRLIYRMTMKGNFNEQYLEKFMNATMGSARAKASDARTKSEVAQVRTDLEIYYDENNNSYENYKLPDYLDLKADNIRTNRDAYVIWSELSSVEDMWCSDSTGRSGYVLEGITDFKCPDLLTDAPIGADKKIQGVGAQSSPSNVKMNVGFDMDVSYSEFNQSVIIEKPEGAVNFFKDLGNLGFTPGLGSANNSGSDTDKDGLEDYMESYYQTDLNNPDSDGDGYKDGDEVKNGYDPAKPGAAKLEFGSWN